MAQSAQIVVIGAGVAGLVVARDLARAGVAVTVVEASDRLGGQLTSVPIAGLDIDAAAESFATRGGVVEQLAAELGLADDIVAAARLAGLAHRAARTLPSPSRRERPRHPR